MLYFLFLVTVLATGLYLSIYYFKREALGKERQVLGGVLAVSLLTIFFFASMGVFPKLETFLPVTLFLATIQSTLWYILVLVFFGALMGLAKPHQKRGLLIMNFFFMLVVLFRIQHLFVKPNIYRSEATAEGGICYQSTSFSCGAASVVNYLSLEGVKITEGEAATMAKTQPYGGTTLLQATWAVNQYLKENSIDRILEMKTLTKDALIEVDRPCLAVIKLYGISHLICIEKVEGGLVFVMDSTRGKVKESLEDFLGTSRGVIAI